MDGVQEFGPIRAIVLWGRRKEKASAAREWGAFPDGGPFGSAADPPAGRVSVSARWSRLWHCAPVGRPGCAPVLVWHCALAALVARCAGRAAGVCLFSSGTARCRACGTARLPRLWFLRQISQKDLARIVLVSDGHNVAEESSQRWLVQSVWGSAFSAVPASALAQGLEAPRPVAPKSPNAIVEMSIVLGNPLHYTDPSGHKYCDGESNGDCRTGNPYSGLTFDELYGIDFIGTWDPADQQIVRLAVADTSTRLAGQMPSGETPWAAFREV